MTDQKTERPNEGKTARGFQAEFNALPLDEKFSTLLQMEVATLNEAFTYVANSSMKAFEKVGDAISDLGSKIENEAKKATGANTPKADAGKPKSSTAKPKTNSKRKPSPPRVPKA